MCFTRCVAARTILRAMRIASSNPWRIMRAPLLALALVMSRITAIAQAQPLAGPVWQMQDSGTTAGLRGIDSVDGTVAWASGTGGTVLQTVDGGAHWTQCAVPDADKDGATLDFRGVQAWDASTAIVMASGPGDESRLYKTTDGCETWTLLFTNPDKEGFWDTFRFSDSASGTGHGTDGLLVGDPARGKFTIFRSSDAGGTWRRWGGMESDQEGSDKENQAGAQRGESLFAASNSSLSPWTNGGFVFVTGGTSGARFIYSDERGFCVELGGTCSRGFSHLELPMQHSGATSGAFAIGSEDHHGYFPMRMMIVGGDYSKPNQTSGTAIFLASRDGAHVPSHILFRPGQPHRPAPRLPLRRAMVRVPQTLDHRGHQRFRHQPRRREDMAAAR